MKRGKYEPGDVVELHRDGRFGYCRALMRDEFSVLFEIFDLVTETSVPLRILTRSRPRRKAVSYVNEPSAKKAWRYVGNIPIDPMLDEIPLAFSGHPSFGWTIHEGGNEKRIPAKQTSFEELLSRGFVSRTLWLAKNLEDCLFEGKELRWNWNP